MIKKFSQDPRVWVNYADFLLSSKQNREAGRALLQRAMQALPQDQHKDLISKFAKLEFRSGDPERGRTLFENLLATFKKKSDLYNAFLDMEIKYGSEEDDGKGASEPYSRGLSLRRLRLVKLRLFSRSGWGSRRAREMRRVLRL